MTDFKTEMIIYLIQILILLTFTFILNDILAALIVSFLSRPLVRMSVNFFKQNLNNK